MALFEIEQNGAKYEIEAADEHTAMAAFRSLGSQPEPAQNAPPASPARATFDPAAHDPTLGPLYAPGQTPSLSGSPTNPGGQQIPVMGQDGVARAFWRGSGQGVTFGFGDEAVGGIAALGGGDYNQAVAESRAANREAREAHPWAYGAGQLVGGVAGAAPMMAATPAAFGLRAGMAISPRMLAGALSGTALGGVQGYGEGEGGFGDRVMHAIPGAATGATFGLTGPVFGTAIGAGVRGAANYLAPKLPGLGRAASTEAVNAFEQAGPQMVRQRAAELGPQAMVLDLGQPFLGRAQGIAAQPGEAGERLVSGLRARDAGTNSRLRSEIEGAFGPAVPAADVETQFAARRAAAGPIYEQATAQAGPIDTTGVLATLGRRITTAEGPERAALERALDYLMPARGPNRTRIVQTDARNLHSAKEALDNLIQYGDPTIGVPRGAFSARDSAVYTIRRELNDALEAQVPRYADANLMASTAHRASEALESGKRVLATGESAIDPADFARATAGLPIEQRAALQHGVRGDIERRLGTHANDLVELRRQVMSDGDWNRAKLAQVFGPDEADRVFRAVDRETAFRDAFNRIYNGSNTAKIAEGVKAMGVRDARPSAGDMSIPISAAAGGYAGAAMAVGGNAARRGWNMLGRDRDLARNREIGEFLLRQAGGRDAAISAMTDAVARRTSRRGVADKTDRMLQILLSTEGRQDAVSDRARAIGLRLLAR